MKLQENQSNQPAKCINLIAHGWDDVEAKLPDGSEPVEDFGEDSDVQPVAGTEPVEDSDKSKPVDMKKITETQWQNLPPEMANQFRFIPSCIAPNGDKKPVGKKAPKPDYCSTAEEAVKIAKHYEPEYGNAFAALDICGYGKGDNYLFLDFDHVLDDNGDFVNAEAEDWYGFVQLRLKGYCELSASRTGIHIFAVPTPGKFGKLDGNKTNRLWFSRDPEIFLEVFYRPDNGRKTCHMTGEIYDTDERTIAKGAVVDEVLTEILAAIAPPEAHAADKPAEQPARAELPADVQALVNAVNHITPAELEEKGYLKHSEKGAPRPTGYICPYCGSGTHSKKTGAFTYYARDVQGNDSPHFTCHICNKGGDVLKLLAEAYGADCRGKNFYAVLRRAADDFGIPYDPAIFERKQPDRPAVFPDVSVVFADNEDLRGKLNEWQRLNGVIYPLCLPELKNAVEYLDSLTLNDITAEGVQSSKTRLYVALCETYDLHEYTQKFWALLKEAKRDAKTRLKDDDDAELTAHLSLEERVQLNSLVAGVDMQRLRNRITSAANDLAKAQREYVKSEKQRLVREEVQRKQAARAEHLSDMKKRLENLKTQDPCPERDKAIVDTIKQLCTWKHDRAGNPVAVEPTQFNADLIFGSDPDIDGLVGYNEFADSDEFLKSPPWSKDTRRGDEFKDADSDRLAVFLRRTYTEFGNKELLSQNVTEISRANQFNPVKEYFKDLPAWDGKERAETLFIDWLKVEDTPFVREVTRKILLAAVARIFHPGCTFQNAVVLHGNQKIGKGYILERLGGKFYKAITDRVDDPHAADTVKITWIGEFKEMAAMKKADVDAIKEFIELPADTRRFAYERRARTVKRHCVFFLSVNDDEFLSDLTGNRRFWILHSPLPKFGWQPEVRGERLSDDNVVKQIWAEVYAKYQELFKDGFDERKLTLSREAEIAGEEIAEQYVRSDGGVEGIIRTFVDTKIPDPVIWSLLSREQRRDFFVKGGMIALYQDDLIAKRKARGGRNEGDDVSKIHQLCTPDNQLGDSKLYAFYGTEYRQHICAAEIRDECFDKTDKRANPARIGEILKRLEGWTLGKRIGHDFVYGNQRKVYWRDAGNIPTDDAPADKPTDDTQPAKDYVDDLGGEPIDPNVMPF